MRFGNETVLMRWWHGIRSHVWDPMSSVRLGLMHVPNVSTGQDKVCRRVLQHVNIWVLTTLLGPFPSTARRAKTDF